MPLALADAISGLEAAPLAAARVLVFLGEAAADSFEDDPVEELGDAEGGAAAGAEVEAGDSDTAPDSITAFLLLRAGLLVVAVVSVLASLLAGSVAAVSEVFLLFFLFCFDTVSLGDDAVLSEAAVAVSAVAVSAAVVFFLFFDFFVLEAVVSAAVVLSVAAAAWSSTLVSFFAFFFFFFLLVGVVVWSSVEVVV
jgi:hypothetical protein